MKHRVRQQPDPRLVDILRLWGMPLVLVFAICAALAWGVMQLRDPRIMPVRLVGVEGEMRYLNRDSLKETVHEASRGSFFSLDLGRIRTELEQLPWVESATIRRVWPDSLQVRVEEQQPMARWGKDALINQRGEVFRPQPLPKFPRMTLLEGMEQDAVSISRKYQRIKTLLDTVGIDLEMVRVDARQAWWLQTRDGLQLILGRRDVMRRLTRFIQLYPKLSGESGASLKQVDLRYTNGFTASWELPPELQSRRENPNLTDEANRFVGI